jgi:TetR/AcrR family transcriptional regulator, transcriptional repressor for nem operon
MEAVRELIWTGSFGSTTIDQICEKAGVKKGSFYYFFESKADLAVLALEEKWESHRVDLDRIFSSTVPPLERLKQYCEYNYRFQKEICTQYGRVLGCPLFSLGAEVSTQEDELQKKIQGILDQKRKYLESAIRDAHAAGLIHAPEAKRKAQVLFAYYQGLATQARIENDLEPLRTAVQGTYDLLGIEETQAVPA